MASRFGAFVPQGWKMDLVNFRGGPAQYRALRSTALQAERLGFDSIWVYDHFHTVPQPSQEATFECWTLMAALAVETQRIRLGQMVTCNSYRPPALLAKLSSNVDAISNGRLEFGIGAGWYEHEYLAYGYPFPPVSERLKQMEEGIKVIKAMWTQDEARFEGRYFQVRGAINRPKPVQKPHPPLWIGGGGEKVTLRILAHEGDASNFNGTPDEVAHKCRVLEQHCRDVGRDYDEIVKSVSFEPVIIAEDEREVRRVAERDRPARYRSLDDWSQSTLIGTPEQCIERIRTYESLGVRYFICYFLGAADDPAPMRLFAEQVLPAFR